METTATTTREGHGAAEYESRRARVGAAPNRGDQMNQHPGQNLKPGDVVGLHRHGGMYRATVVGTGPVNARVRYTCNNGKEKTVSEPYALLTALEQPTSAPRPTLQPTGVEKVLAEQREFQSPRPGRNLVANATQEAAARRIYQGDWDSEGTVAVYLPDDVGTKLLESCGWRYEEWGTARGPVGQWVSPNGDRRWEREGALQIALTSITMGGAR